MAEDRSDKVRVEGLAKVQAALRAADKELAKLLRVEQKKLAEYIVDRTESEAASRGGALGKAARGGAYEAKGEQRYAKVVLRGDKFPYVSGGEFGSIRYKQFEPWRGNKFTDPLGQNVGYALFPTLRRERGHIIDTYDEMLDDLLSTLARL